MNFSMSIGMNFFVCTIFIYQISQIKDFGTDTVDFCDRAHYQRNNSRFFYTQIWRCRTMFRRPTRKSRYILLWYADNFKYLFTHKRLRVRGPGRWFPRETWQIQQTHTTKHHQPGRRILLPSCSKRCSTNKSNTGLYPITSLVYLHSLLVILLSAKPWGETISWSRCLRWIRWRVRSISLLLGVPTNTASGVTRAVNLCATASWLTIWQWLQITKTKIQNRHFMFVKVPQTTHWSVITIFAYWNQHVML